MKVDSFGVVHPEQTDEPSLAGALHITECGPCQTAFGPIVVVYCLQLAEAYEADEREKARVRKR